MRFDFQNEKVRASEETKVVLCPLGSCSKFKREAQICQTENFNAPVKTLLQRQRPREKQFVRGTDRSAWSLFQWYSLRSNNACFATISIKLLNSSSMASLRTTSILGKVSHSNKAAFDNFNVTAKVTMRA